MRGRGNTAHNARLKPLAHAVAVILVLVASFGFRAIHAQQVLPPPDTARARRVLAGALATLGGAERIARVATWDIEGKGRENLSAEAQGISPGQPTWREHEERVVVDARTLTVAWQRRTPRNDGSVRWRRMIHGPDRTGFVDLTSGRGVLRPVATPMSRSRGMARRVPHLLLLEAATSARSVTWIGERAIDGELHDVIRAVMTDSAELTLSLARRPRILRRLEYQAHLPSRGNVAVEWTWSGWVGDSTLGMRPRAHHVRIDDTLFQQVDYVRYAADMDIAAMLTIDDTAHTASRPALMIPAASGVSATGEVAPGVHLTNVAGFVVMAVEFDSFVVAIEAPEAHPGFELIPPARPQAGVSVAHIAWLREIARGKPIRYTIISHHHSDHLGGARALAATGATLLVSPGDVTITQRSLAAPDTIAGDELHDRIAGGRIEAVSDQRSIEDHARRLEVIQVGANPHTDENLVVWLPRERILFQGDLFYYAEGSPFPPAGRERMNRFFAGWLTERGIQPLAVYGVHNDGAAGPEWLSRAR